MTVYLLISKAKENEGIVGVYKSQLLAEGDIGLYKAEIDGEYEVQAWQVRENPVDYFE